MRNTLLVYILFIAAIETCFSQKQYPNMVLIPGSEYTMGSNITNSLGFSPAHKVRVGYRKKGLISSWCDFAVGFRCVKDIDK